MKPEETAVFAAVEHTGFQISIFSDIFFIISTPKGRTSHVV